MVMGKTPEEMLVEEKEQLFLGDIEESKTRQQRIITQCDNEIAYSQSQITIQQGKREAAQKLLEELDARYPKEIEEIPEE